MIGALLAAALASPSSASAIAPCKPGNGVDHCYDVAQHFQPTEAMVYSTQLQANIVPTANVFATSEGWAEFGTTGGGYQFGDWIEAGLMVYPRGENGDMRPHNFWATEHEGSLYVHIEPVPAGYTPETAPRSYFTITGNGGGCYWIRTLLSHENAGWYWKITLAVYCGRLGAIPYPQIGGETMPEPSIRVSGHTESALSEGENGRTVGAWQPFSPVQYVLESPEIVAGINQQNPGPGNLEWHTAQLPTASAQAASAARMAKAGMTVTHTGKPLSANLKLTALGGHRPTGLYRAQYRNSLGILEDEYVGNQYPTEAEVRSAGSN